MRRGAVSLAVSLGVLMLAGLGSGTAVAGVSKLVEGTVYDATCGVACFPCPPPCGGPIPAPQSRRDDVICAQQRRIVCPLTQSDRAAGSPDFCIQGQPCGVVYPVYSGEGAVVTVRKRGTSAVLATLPVVEGHFKIRLAPGEYAIHPYLPEPRCWSGTPSTIEIAPKMKSPVPATIDVTDSCVAHPSSR